MERYIITDLNDKNNVGISYKTELHKINQLKVIQEKKEISYRSNERTMIVI